MNSVQLPQGLLAPVPNIIDPQRQLIELPLSGKP